MNAFRNAWGKDILIAPFQNNARGVAILTKRVKLNICQAEVDEDGNYIIAKVILKDIWKMILVNVYGPNNDSPKFYEKIGHIFFRNGERKRTSDYCRRLKHGSRW